MRCFCNQFVRLGLSLAGVILLGANMAIAQHSDLELFDDNGQVGVELRLAEGEFGESPNPAYRANEPGVESDPDELVLEGETPLPGGALVGFEVQLFTMDSVTKSLFYWNGVGSVNFTSVPSPYELKVSDATESFSVQIDGTSAAAGFNFAITADGTGIDPAGFVHQDLIFDLVDAGGAGISNPAAGVYAFSTTFRVPGLNGSEPVFWVMATGVEESIHEAAVEYVALSQGLIPEPTSLALLGGLLLAGAGFLGRNRRNEPDQAKFLCLGQSPAVRGIETPLEIAPLQFFQRRSVLLAGGARRSSTTWSQEKKIPTLTNFYWSCRPAQGARVTRSGTEVLGTEFRLNALSGPQRVVWNLQRGTEGQDFAWKASRVSSRDFFFYSFPKMANHTRRRGGTLHKNL